MLEFITQPEFSRWLTNHCDEMHTFQRENRHLSYRVLDDNADPEIPLFFGYNQQEENFFVSASTPIAIRKELVIFEDLRVHFCKGASYAEALRNIKFPRRKRRLIITKLNTFFSSYLSIMEEVQHGRNILRDDIMEALEILRGTRAHHRAA